MRVDVIARIREKWTGEGAPAGQDAARTAITTLLLALETEQQKYATLKRVAENHAGCAIEEWDEDAEDYVTCGWCFECRLDACIQGLDGRRVVHGEAGESSLEEQLRAAERGLREGREAKAEVERLNAIGKLRCRDIQRLHAAQAQSIEDWGKLRAQLAEAKAEGAREALDRIVAWTRAYGAALVPVFGRADSYGDGMREAKRQVAELARLEAVEKAAREACAAFESTRADRTPYHAMKRLRAALEATDGDV